MGFRRCALVELTCREVPASYLEALVPLQGGWPCQGPFLSLADRSPRLAAALACELFRLARDLGLLGGADTLAGEESLLGARDVGQAGREMVGGLLDSWRKWLAAVFAWEPSGTPTRGAFSVCELYNVVSAGAPPQLLAESGMGSFVLNHAQSGYLHRLGQSTEFVALRERAEKYGFELDCGGHWPRSGQAAFPLAALAVASFCGLSSEWSIIYVDLWRAMLGNIRERGDGDDLSWHDNLEMAIWYLNFPSHTIFPAETRSYSMYFQCDAARAVRATLAMEVATAFSTSCRGLQDRQVNFDQDERNLSAFLDFIVSPPANPGPTRSDRKTHCILAEAQYSALSDVAAKLGRRVLALAGDGELDEIVLAVVLKLCSWGEDDLSFRSQVATDTKEWRRRKVKRLVENWLRGCVQGVEEGAGQWQRQNGGTEDSIVLELASNTDYQWRLSRDYLRRTTEFAWPEPFEGEVGGNQFVDLGTALSELEAQ